jgi:hypothetical protein
MTENLLANPNQDLAEAQAQAAKFLDQIDNDDTGIPPLPLEPLLTVWSITDANVGDEPAMILTFANSALPMGIPVILVRDRALKLASQIRRHAQGGGVPVIATPPNAGKLIIPGRQP